MRIRSLCPAIAFFTCLGAFSGSASASAFSFTGTFVSDDQSQVFSFVAGAGSAIIRTWGYGGSGAGTNAAGQIILPGGFDPYLSLFDAGSSLLLSTPLLAVNDNGGASVVPDPITGEFFDSYLDTAAVPLTLTPGAKYWVVLTESPSSPLGSTYGDGFSGDGQGNYTGSIYGCLTAGFCDADGNQRNGNWALDISGVVSAHTVPEPAPFWMTGTAFAILLFVWRRRILPAAGQPR